MVHYPGPDESDTMKHRDPVQVNPENKRNGKNEQNAGKEFKDPLRIPPNPHEPDDKKPCAPHGMKKVQEMRDYGVGVTITEAVSSKGFFRIARLKRYG